MEQNHQTKFQNVFYGVAGIGFLILAKTKHMLQGYSTPKPFSIYEYDKCIEYDLRVVDRWLSFLENYTNRKDFICDKNVLELGPGSDLGVGLYLLSKGIAKYNVIDVNSLVEKVPHSFYELLFDRLKELDERTDIEFLRDQFERIPKGNNDKLNYVCRDNFDILSSFRKESIDIVFSQAAFEHFDDIENTINQLSQVAKSGAIIIAEIDLKTHSRLIRDKDPLNIYRYSKRFYRLFGFKGIPNRIRPYQYKEIFEEHGWKDIVIKPLITLNDSNFEKVRYSLNKDFQNEKNQMSYLSVMLCARKL